jgi:hypothetical protein
MRDLGQAIDRTRPLARIVGSVLPIFLVTRLGVLVVGYLALIGFGYPNETPPIRLYDNEVMNLPFRYDVGWYFSIASQGYRWDPADTGQQSIAFFPAFPTAAHQLSRIIKLRFMGSAMLVTFLAALGAFVYFFRLARQDLGDEQARVALALLATYPFALFFSVPYTESMCLLCVVGAWFHWRRGGHLASGAWGLVAGLTRPNGCLLSVPLGIMAVQSALRERKERGSLDRGKLIRHLVAAAMPGVGMLIFSAYVYTLTGRPFEWSTAHAAWGRHYRPISETAIDWFWAPGGFGDETGAALMVDYIGGLLALAAIALSVPIYRRFGLAPAAFTLLSVVPPILLGGLVSIGRLTSVVFPVFLWLGATVPSNHRSAWLACFAMGQALAASMFFTWRPVY